MIVTYTLTRLYTLVLPVSTSQGPQIVEFKGVQNMKMRGQFTTNNAEMQSVLESQPEYQKGVYRITARVPEPNDANTSVKAHPQTEASTSTKAHPQTKMHSPKK